MHHENSYFYHLLNYHKNTKYLSLEQMNTLIHYMNNHYYCHEHRNYQFLKKKKTQKIQRKRTPSPPCCCCCTTRTFTNGFEFKIFYLAKTT